MRVIIVGAGIAGLALADELANMGIRAEVYDKKESITYGAEKASGVLSIDGLRASGLPYANAVLNTLDGAVLYAGSQKLTIESRTPKAYVIDRARLLLDTYEKAASDGAVITLGKSVSRSELLAYASSGNIVVGADGAVSHTASAFGFPAIKEFALTYKAVYERAQAPLDDKVELVFSEATPGFFGWIVPYGKGMIEVGVGVSTKAKRNSRKAFDDFSMSSIVQAHAARAKRASGYASMIPLSARSTTVKGNVALVGDAAGQVKATTGGGIIFGVACAKMLAKAISDTVSNGVPLEAYERMWRKAYGRDLKLHALAHRYYLLLGAKNFEVLFKLSRLFGMEGFLGRYGDMDSPSKIIKRFFLRR
ncbi:MAG: FAD-dependent monooxygenase [Candidatus Micrarchaeia archaeon]